MQKQIKKSFRECFQENQKISNKPTQSPWRSLKPFKTPSISAAGKEKEDDALSLSYTDQFLFENLRSFYRKLCEKEMAKIGRLASLQSESPPRFIDSPLRSARLFAAFGSSSASATGGSSPAEEAKEISASDSSVLDDFIAILTYSQRPYEDFRRSMREMVEARLEREGVVDRKFMQELLFRYLDLNNEKFYGCIMRAFLDLIVVSREDSGKLQARRWPLHGRGGRRKLKLEIKCMRKFSHKGRF